MAQFAAAIPASLGAAASAVAPLAAQAAIAYGVSRVADYGINTAIPKGLEKGQKLAKKHGFKKVAKNLGKASNAYNSATGMAGREIASTAAALAGFGKSKAIYKGGKTFAKMGSKVGKRTMKQAGARLRNVFKKRR